MRSLIPVAALPRLLIALAAGGVSAVADAGHGIAEDALIGIGVAGGIFVVAGWLVLWPMDAETTRRNAHREDFRPRVDEVVIVGFALAGLGGVVALLVEGGAKEDSWAPAIAVVAVSTAWAALHLMYATRYAHEFYIAGEVTPIDFNSGDDFIPRFSDFLYFSYNLGMTYQVSDTNLQTSEIRAVVMRHCLLAYVFGTAILATTINLVVGVLTA
ncbi:MAG: DUF1345 domain-containing protein [Aeromicrobium sp.]